MRLKKGMVFKNEWAKNETYFVYRESNKGFAKGIRFTRDKSGWKIKRVSDYEVIWFSESRFTLIGMMDIEKLLLDRLKADVEMYQKNNNKVEVDCRDKDDEN